MDAVEGRVNEQELLLWTQTTPAPRQFVAGQRSVFENYNILNEL
jgi:hypothetical protein